MEKKSTMKLENHGPVYVDMTNEGGFLRSECADRFRAALEKSERTAERRKNNWRLADKLFQNAVATLIAAGLSFVIFVLLTCAKAQYDAGQTNVQIGESIFLFYGFLTAVLAVVTLTQIIVSKVLERS